MGEKVHPSLLTANTCTVSTLQGGELHDLTRSVLLRYGSSSPCCW